MALWAACERNVVGVNRSDTSKKRIDELMNGKDVCGDGYS